MPSRRAYPPLRGTQVCDQPQILRDPHTRDVLRDCRARYSTYRALAADAAQCPVAVESGKPKHTQFRWACDQRLRQAFCTLSDASRRYHPWAADSYARARARGASHTHATRVLDRAWSYVTNVSRNVGNGWVNEHFINDGATTNHFPAGEPMCDSSVPGGGGTAFNRTATVAWANAHWHDKQPYPAACTWFVSQALWAGGLPRTSTWTSDGSHGTWPFSWRPGTAAAWAVPDFVSYIMGAYPHSYIRQLKFSPSTNSVPDGQPGDVILYDWYGNSSVLGWAAPARRTHSRLRLKPRSARGRVGDHRREPDSVPEPVLDLVSANGPMASTGISESAGIPVAHRYVCLAVIARFPV